MATVLSNEGARFRWRMQDAAAAPTHEEIARRAYHLWEAAGRRHGGDVDDWVQAERELVTSPFAWRTPPR